MVRSVEQADRQLLGLLQQRPHSVQELVDATQVTATAVRQRLNRLTGEGLVERKTARAARGRPHHDYRVTEKGSQVLGRNYTDLAVTLWRELRKLSGDRNTARELFQRVSEALAEKYEAEVGGGSLHDRLKALRHTLAERGIEVEVDSAGPRPILREYQCPYQELAESDRSICAMEKQVFEKLLHSKIRLSQCRLDGHGCCEFHTHDIAMPELAVP